MSMSDVSCIVYKKTETITHDLSPCAVDAIESINT